MKADNLLWRCPDCGNAMRFNHAGCKVIRLTEDETMKLPLRVEYIPGANRSTGEPAWKVADATGWPVCLCWSEDYAKRIVASFGQPPSTEQDLQGPYLSMGHNSEGV